MKTLTVRLDENRSYKLLVNGSRRLLIHYWEDKITYASIGAEGGKLSSLKGIPFPFAPEEYLLLRPMVVNHAKERSRALRDHFETIKLPDTRAVKAAIEAIKNAWSLQSLAKGIDLLPDEIKAIAFRDLPVEHFTKGEITIEEATVTREQLNGLFEALAFNLIINSFGPLHEGEFVEPEGYQKAKSVPAANVHFLEESFSLMQLKEDSPEPFIAICGGGRISYDWDNAGVRFLVGLNKGQKKYVANSQENASINERLYYTKIVGSSDAKYKSIDFSDYQQIAKRFINKALDYFL